MSTDIAAIYARQSKDKKVSIDQQVEIGRKVAAEQGWPVGEVYTDGTSASRFATKGRTDWTRLLADLGHERFRVMILWEPSRGDRDLATWTRMLADARAHKVLIYVITHERLYNPSLARDWKALAEDGLDSAYESEKTSLRVLRMTDARAAEGKPHGQQAYGYRRVDGRDVIDLTQAAVIRRAARQVLDGYSMRSIVAGLNDDGIEAPRGGRWDGAILRQVLLRERNAGRRVHRGKVVGPGDWEPLLEPGEFDRMKAILRDPSRRTARGNENVHLLSGLAVCELCGGTMRVVSRKVRPDGRTSPASYNCRECFRVKRKQADVDEVVERVVIARLSMPDGPDLLAGDPDALREAEEEAEALRARLNIAADQYADGDLDAEQLTRITAKLKPQIAAALERARAAAPPPRLASLAGPDVAKAWKAASLEVKRMVIDLLMTVTIKPAGRGQRFDPTSVVITPKK